MLKPQRGRIGQLAGPFLGLAAVTIVFALLVKNEINDQIRFGGLLFAGFIGKLKDTADGDGSLLDHTLIVYGSGLSDGNRHAHEDLPVAIVGRGGNFRLGQPIVYPKGTPMNNLFLTLLDRMGVQQETIGDSTGRIEHLTDL